MNVWTCGHKILNSKDNYRIILINDIKVNIIMSMKNYTQNDSKLPLDNDKDVNSLNGRD